MAYQITVEGKYGSRNGSYILDLAPKGQPDKFIREKVDIVDRTRLADVYKFRIRDLDMDDEYEEVKQDPKKLDADCRIIFEEPWIFFHCSTEQMMNFILEYLKEGNWDFAHIYDNKLVNLPLTQKVTLCYPLHVPHKPIIERQKTFKVLRAAAPLILADMFGLSIKDVEVYPINKTFDPNHWSWSMNKAKEIAREEGLDASDLY